jgi:hypothetical protein
LSELCGFKTAAFVSLNKEIATMRNYRTAFGIFVTALVFLVSGLAIAADAKKPDGSVTIDETQFAFIIGGSVGAAN